MKNKYCIINSNSSKSKELIKEFEKLIDHHKWELDEKKFDFLFIFGGDGTVLRNIFNFINKNIKIIVINGGTFGFFASFNKKNINNIFNEICDDKKYISPLMLKLSCNKKKYYSLNEIVISSNHLLKAEIFIDNKKYETFKGTGLLFSTPFGSTGRSRSCKGSVIFPNNNVYQMIELEPINQKKYNTLNSSIIMNPKNKFNINIKSFIDHYNVLIDSNNILFKKNEIFKIEVFKPKFKLFFINQTDLYIDKLRNKFISTE